MPRASRKPGRFTIGSRAVAVAILTEVMIHAQPGMSGQPIDRDDVQRWADKLVGMAWDVEYKPTSERLVLILDAGITSEDKMRSTPEDVPVLSDEEAIGSGADQCPYISNGKQCPRLAGHPLPHF